MSVVIGIDVGGSTTKIVGFEKADGRVRLIAPELVVANDPLTSAYGAFGRFMDVNDLALADIERVMMTGVGSAFVKKDLYGLECRKVEEFNSIGLGGLHLSRLDDALVVSLGTGTAIVHATSDGKMDYLGGTGVGGGTLMGLSRILGLGESVEHIMKLAESGSLDNVDLRIKDITATTALTELSRELTASNFGNVSSLVSKADTARGVANLVFETVGMVSIFAARSVGVSDIVLTGNLTSLPLCKAKFEQFNNLGYGVRFVIPELASYGTVIGTALYGL